jgi:hypothetical protein
MHIAHKHNGEYCTNKNLLCYHRSLPRSSLMAYLLNNSRNTWDLRLRLRRGGNRRASVQTLAEVDFLFAMDHWASARRY